MKNGQHYRSLDGLRGLAALSVVLFHYAVVFVPIILGFSVAHNHIRTMRLLSTSPLSLPLAGNFAVCIFFVLSGFVLSLRFFQTQDNSVLVSSASRRFFRLMIPASGSVLLAYLLLRPGLMFIHQATVISGSPSVLTQYYLFPAHLGQAAFQAFYGVWLGNSNVLSSYNSVLWTMHYELFGSFLIFMFLALFGKLTNRWVFYSLFALFFLKTYYLCFIAGIVISDVYITQPGLKDKLSEKLVWASLPIGLVLGTWRAGSVYKSLYSIINVPFFTNSQLELFAHMAGAIIVVLAVLKLKLLSKVLETRPLQYLGKVSFSLYLTHFLIMSSLSSYVFIHILPVYGYRIAVLGAVIVGLPVTFLVATYYTKWVDVPSIALSKRLGSLLLHGKLPQGAWRRSIRTGLQIINPARKITVEEAVVE